MAKYSQLHADRDARKGALKLFKWQRLERWRPIFI